MASDRPVARSRAATLRIKRGAKTLSEIALGRAKLVVGGGATAQLRLKNAGLPDECIVLDTRETPFKLSSRLGPDQVLVNGWAVETSTVKPGDRIEFSGITLELIAPEAEAREAAPATARPAAPAPPPPAPRGPPPAQPPAAQPTDADFDDPYMGRRTAAKMRREDLERVSAKLRAERAEPPERRNDPTDFDGPGSGGKVGRDNRTERDLPPARSRAADPTDHDRADARVARDNRTERDLPPARNRGLDPTDHDRGPAPAPVAPPRPRNDTERDLPPARGKKSLVLEAIDEVGPIPPTGFSRPPWLESVGDAATAGAKLYLLQSVVVVGRQGDLRVNHPSVSKKHAKFSTKGATLLLEDLGSTNGTWINRERIAEPRAVMHGDTVHFGAAEFRMHVPGAEEKSEAASLAPEVSSTAELGGMPFGAISPEDPPLVRGSAPEYEDRRASVRANSTEREIPREEIRRGVGAAPPPPPLPTGRNATEREIPRDEIRRAKAERDRSTMERAPARRAPPPPPEELTNAPGLELDEPLELPPPRAARRPDTGTFDTTMDRGARARVRREVQPELLPAPKSRAPVALFAVGLLAFLAIAGGVGGWAAWPTLKPLLSRAAAGGNDLVADRGHGTTAAATPLPTGALASATARPHPLDNRHPGAHAVAATPVQTLVAMIATPEPIPSPTLRPGQILGDEKLDIGGDSRLNHELASLEQGTNNNRLRAEREINADSLQSIYVGEGEATIRRFHPEDGFTMAPSAADSQDAEDRKLGAKQISGDKVNSLIRAHFSEVKQCLVGGRFKGGRARVVLQFTIQPTGRVGDSRVIESDVAGSGFQSCVANVVRRISFPKPKEQAVVVQFPFVFTLN